MVQAAAAAMGVPLTVVNPSTVIGHSLTGESPQTLGLGTTVLDLIAGQAPLLDLNDVRGAEPAVVRGPHRATATAAGTVVVEGRSSRPRTSAVIAEGRKPLTIR